jgi:hypothetical protein
MSLRFILVVRWFDKKLYRICFAIDDKYTPLSFKYKIIYIYYQPITFHSIYICMKLEDGSNLGHKFTELLYTVLIIFVRICVECAVEQSSYWLQAERTKGGSSSTGRVKNFHISIMSRPALGFTQPHIRRGTGGSPRVKSGCVKLTIHFTLVPRSRKCGSIYPLPHVFMA